MLQHNTHRIYFAFLTWRVWFLVGGISLIMATTGCEYDVDEEFYIETRISFLLFEDSNNQDKSILALEDTILTFDWQKKIGLNASSLGDMQGSGSYLWVSDVQGNRILKIDPTAQRAVEIYELGTITPHLMSIGETYILISDTTTTRAGFIHIDKQDIYTRSLPEIPGKSLYRSNKFYLQTGDDILTIFNEQALSPTHSLKLKGTINDLQVEDEKFIVVYTHREDNSETLQASRINYNTDAFTLKEADTRFRKVRHSPYSVANFGKEYLENITLDFDGRLSVNNLNQVADFEADFFESRLFFMRLDSLFSYDIPVSDIRFLGKVEGKMARSWFYEDFIGK